MKEVLLAHHEGYTLLDACFFGDSNLPVDIVINCPHGCSDMALFDSFPNLKQAFAHIPKDVFQTYLDLEYDFGARDLALAVATELSQKRNVVVTRVHYHRGIVDANRLEEYTVRHIFDRHRFPEEDALLREMSRKTETGLITFLQKYLDPNGFFCDSHTMWPTSQHVSPTEYESPQTIEQYVEALLHPENQKKVRSLNMLTLDINDRWIADKARSLALAQTFQRYGYPVEYNTPYRLFPQHRGTRYLSLFPGVAFDIPRSFLGNPDPENLALWSIEHSKMNRLVTALADGLLRAHEAKD